MSVAGREVHGILNSADVTTAAAIPFYEAGGDTSGGQTALTLGAREFLVITEIIIVVAIAGDVHVFLNDDNDGTPDTGETVARGTLAASGGIAKSWIVTPRHGAAGANPYVVAANAGAVDVSFTGRIQNA